MSDVIQALSMKKSNPITGIQLEGFQVFDKPTFIPLDRLTLLFGPNSAGKSAVQDAIELYENLLNSGEPIWVGDGRPIKSKNLYASRYGLDIDDFPDLMARYWRRSDGLDGQRVEKMGIGVTRTVSLSELDVTVARELGRKPLDKSESPHYSQSESRWLLHLDDKQGHLEYEFEFHIDSELFVAHSGLSLCVNLDHPVIRRIEKKIDFDEVARSFPNEVTFKQGFFTLNTGIWGFHPAGRGILERGQNWLDEVDYWVDDQEAPLFRAAKEEVSLLVGYILEILQGSFHASKVDASRTIPTQKDLTFEIGDFDDTTLQRILPRGDLGYEELAISLASDLPQEFGDKATKDIQKECAANVNRALADHLFLDQGYRIDYDFRVLMSKEQSRNAVGGKELNPHGFGYLLELFLRDGKGRKHLFEDVGSGIGYVLPVLCGVFGPRWYGCCYIQQPELHLHPALQAAMGDVFIEASDVSKQVLIETHSEHLLLRILKRIRQTSLQVNIAPELKINADDVCVLYFDPSPDGTTTVKRLRITEDGEFMDRWPRGFFGERDQELLDE